MSRSPGTGSGRAPSSPPCKTTQQHQQAPLNKPGTSAPSRVDAGPLSTVPGRLGSSQHRPGSARVLSTPSRLAAAECLVWCASSSVKAEGDGRWPDLCPCVHHRCVQDPDIIVTVSQIMSLQYTPTEVSEDCLYLNVYAPAEAAPGDKLPVCWDAGDGR